jgi:hypothetical protein
MASDAAAATAFFFGAAAAAFGGCAATAPCSSSEDESRSMTSAGIANGHVAYRLYLIPLGVPVYSSYIAKKKVQPLVYGVFKYSCIHLSLITITQSHTITTGGGGGGDHRLDDYHGDGAGVSES